MKRKTINNKKPKQSEIDSKKLKGHDNNKKVKRSHSEGEVYIGDQPLSTLFKKIVGEEEVSQESSLLTIANNLVQDQITTQSLTTSVTMPSFAETSEYQADPFYPGTSVLDRFIRVGNACFERIGRFYIYVQQGRDNIQTIFTCNKYNDKAYALIGKMPFYIKRKTIIVLDYNDMVQITAAEQQRLIYILSDNKYPRLFNIDDRSPDIYNKNIDEFLAMIFGEERENTIENVVQVPKANRVPKITPWPLHNVFSAESTTELFQRIPESNKVFLPKHFYVGQAHKYVFDFIDNIYILREDENTIYDQELLRKLRGKISQLVRLNLNAPYLTVDVIEVNPTETAADPFEIIQKVYKVAISIEKLMLLYQSNTSNKFYNEIIPFYFSNETPQNAILAFDFASLPVLREKKLIQQSDIPTQQKSKKSILDDVSNLPELIHTFLSTKSPVFVARREDNAQAEVQNISQQHEGKEDEVYVNETGEFQTEWYAPLENSNYTDVFSSEGGVWDTPYNLYQPAEVSETSHLNNQENLAPDEVLSHMQNLGYLK